MSKSTDRPRIWSTYGNEVDPVGISSCCLLCLLVHTPPSPSLILSPRQNKSICLLPSEPCPPWSSGIVDTEVLNLDAHRYSCVCVRDLISSRDLASVHVDGGLSSKNAIKSIFSAELWPKELGEQLSGEHIWNMKETWTEIGKELKFEWRIENVRIPAHICSFKKNIESQSKLQVRKEVCGVTAAARGPSVEARLGTQLSSQPNTHALKDDAGKRKEAFLSSMVNYHTQF